MDGSATWRRHTGHFPCWSVATLSVSQTRRRSSPTAFAESRTFSSSARIAWGNSIATIGLLSVEETVRRLERLERVPGRLLVVKRYPGTPEDDTRSRRWAAPRRSTTQHS